MSEKLETSGSRFPGKIDQVKLDSLLEKAKVFWHGIKERSDFIEKALEKALDGSEEIQIMKEIEDILADIRDLIFLSKEIKLEYEKMNVRINENKQDTLALSYATKLNKARIGIDELKSSLINFADRFRDIELNEIFGVGNNKERQERVLEFSNPELDKIKKEFIKDAKGIEVDLRINFFEEAVMDSILKRLGGELQALSRLDALEALTPNPLSDRKVFSYLERIFRQLVARRDISNAEKVLIKMSKDRFYNLRIGYRYNYRLMLEKAKDDDLYGRHTNN